MHSDVLFGVLWALDVQGSYWHITLTNGIDVTRKDTMLRKINKIEEYLYF